MDYIKEIINPEMKKLEKEKEHLLHQIEMFEDFVHNYKINYREVNNKIDQLNTILNQINLD